MNVGHFCVDFGPPRRSHRAGRGGGAALEGRRARRRGVVGASFVLHAPRHARRSAGVARALRCAPARGARPARQRHRPCHLALERGAGAILAPGVRRPRGIVRARQRHGAIVRAADGLKQRRGPHGATARRPRRAPARRAAPARASARLSSCTSWRRGSTSSPCSTRSSCLGRRARPAAGAITARVGDAEPPARHFRAS